VDTSHHQPSHALCVGIPTFIGLILLACAALAQSPNNIVHGTVFDASHKPVAGAAVTLHQKGGPLALDTRTNATGGFTFPDLPSGTYVLEAERSSLHSPATSIAVDSSAEPRPIELVLSSAATAPEMGFADKPDFTVAGIVDRTAAAGHGADTSLRTSESLAREAAALKPDKPAITLDAQEEASLRADLARAPGSFDANHRLGEFCLHAGSFREAIPPLEAAFQINPGNHANEYDLALAQKGAGDYGAARIHVQNLLAHETTADLHSLLGDLDEHTGDSLSAVREYEVAVRLDPTEQNYFKWGSELLLHRAVEPAIEVFTKGAAAHPQSARMMSALGAALFAAGHDEDAALRLCAASDLNPADPSPYLFLGRIDAVAPAPLPCIEPKLHRFLELQPGDARASYYYGMALWNRQHASDDPRDLEPVETLLARAVSLDPKYDEACLQLGILYFTERNYDKAINLYTRVIEINPQLSEAHYRLGVAYERIGEPAKAKEQFRRHAELERQQAAVVEQQRREVKQFIVVLGQQPPHTSPE